MKTIKQILSLSISIITLLIGFILYQIATYESAPTFSFCNTPVPFCGTKNPELTENQHKGKEIFNSNCAVCHKLDARANGPALRDVDSVIFIKWFSNKNGKIDSTKIEKLGIDYHRTMFKEFVKEKDLALIIEYCSSKRY